MTAVEDQDPACDELADDCDDLDWDRSKHGRMLAAATYGDTVTTVPYRPEDDQ